MPKKSITKPQELIQMRLEIQAMREDLNMSLDALIAKIDSMLPSSELHPRYQKFRRYTPEDWMRLLGQPDKWG